MCSKNTILCTRSRAIFAFSKKLSIKRLGLEHVCNVCPRLSFLLRFYSGFCFGVILGPSGLLGRLLAENIDEYSGLRWRGREIIEKYSSWALLGLSWALLGALGPSWARLGALPGRAWGLSWSLPRILIHKNICVLSNSRSPPPWGSYS